MRRTIGERVEKAVTSDAAGLCLLGVAALVRFFSYMPGQGNPDRDPAHWLESLLPMTGWAWVWLAVGVACILAAFWRRLIPIAVGMAVGLNASWALSFIGIWAIGESSRGYVSAIGYAVTAGLAIWGFGRGTAEVNIKIEKE